MSIMATPPQASDIDDIHREDENSGHNGSGYERDETDTALHQLVRHLGADGDRRAARVGRRRARRTLADMAPGYERQPILRMAPGIVFEASEQARGYAA
ncbi:hypothetical protein [Streptomyces sp. NPDC056061]|uniref:hypothetical protein n=1 Tax=Streptomyces sp. NPDC056061 TaxID=3345700 RepID=UPI0035E16B23